MDGQANREHVSHQSPCRRFLKLTEVHSASSNLYLVRTAQNAPRWPYLEMAPSMAKPICLHLRRPFRATA